MADISSLTMRLAVAILYFRCNSQAFKQSQ
jgi:hypothetical protein